MLGFSLKDQSGRLMSLGHPSLRLRLRLRLFNLDPPLLACTSTIHRTLRSSSSSSPDASGAPLLHLRSAQILPPKHQRIAPNGASQSDTIDLCIGDAPQCWAIVGGEGRGEAVREALRDVILGRRKPLSLFASSNTTTHALHPFLQPDFPPSHHILHLSFGARASNAGAFVDYSARYAAVRNDEDAVTLYEAAMRSLGFSVGQVARLSCVADDLLIAPTEADKEAVALGKEKQRSAAWKAHEKIMRTATMLRLDRPPPASDLAGVRKHEQSTALLHTPLIRLSNGQMRRARLMDALVRCSSVPGSASNSSQAGPGALLVLSQPYNGLDASTRSLLSEILQERHAARDPRILLFLRAQDEVPDFITHVAFIAQDGRVRAGEREEMLDVMRRQADSDAHAQGSYGLVKQLATSKRNEPSLGQSSAPLVKFTNVGVKYAGKMALDEITFEVHPGTRMVLVGDNGSGKSTLLSLILGDHPQSFSIPSDRISLFGAPRSAPSNATLLLARRIGHVSPELFNAFPRKDSERGGLTVGQAVGSGFEGVFSRRALNEEQRERVWSMLALFHDVIGSQTDQTQSAPFTNRSANECAAPTAAMLPFDPRSSDALDAAKKLSEQSFSSLSLGSQSIVLLLRAAISNPPLLILDEPFQHQNSHQVERCRAFLDSSAPHSALYQVDAGQATRDAFAIGKTAEERERDALQRRSAAIIAVSHYESEWPQSISSLIRLDAGRVVERLGS